MMRNDGKATTCCWESLWDYSLVKLKLQPSQTELLFRSVADSFLAMRTGEASTLLLGLLEFCEENLQFVVEEKGDGGVGLLLDGEGLAEFEDFGDLVRFFPHHLVRH